jgi:hypothetical protein
MALRAYNNLIIEVLLGYFHFIFALPNVVPDKLFIIRQALAGRRVTYLCPINLPIYFLK